MPIFDDLYSNEKRNYSSSKHKQSPLLQSSMSLRLSNGESDEAYSMSASNSTSPTESIFFTNSLNSNWATINQKSNPQKLFQKNDLNLNSLYDNEFKRAESSVFSSLN